MSSWSQMLKQHTASALPKKRKRKKMTESITKKLRDIETAYALPHTDLATIQRARELITDLWALHREKNPNIHALAAELFEDNGLGVRK